MVNRTKKTSRRISDALRDQCAWQTFFEMVDRQFATNVRRRGGAGYARARKFQMKDDVRHEAYAKLENWIAKDSIALAPLGIRSVGELLKWFSDPANRGMPDVERIEHRLRSTIDWAYKQSFFHRASKNEDGKRPWVSKDNLQNSLGCEAADQLPSGALPPDKEAMRAEFIQLVREAVFALDDAELRKLIELQLEGCSLRDISEKLGITKSAVRYRWDKARQHLRKYLEAKGISEED